MYLLVIFCTFACLARCQICYWPNGDLALDNYPCNPSDAASFCCQVGSVCSTNQLCVDEYGTYRRGSCTDVSWESSSCPNFCTKEVNGTHTDNGGYDDLTQCGDSTSTNFVACCGDPGNYYNCDCNNTPHITLGAFSIFTTISAPSSTTVASSISATSDSASTSINTSKSSSAAFLSATQIASSTLLSPESTSSSNPISSTRSSSALSPGAVAGIAVGAVAAVLIITVLAIFLWRSRRQLKQFRPEPRTELDPTPLPQKFELSESSTDRSPAMTAALQGSSPRSTGTAGQRHELSSGSDAPHEIGTLQRLQG